MLSIQQLLNASTRRSVLDWAIELLKAFGFETTGWQDGRIQKTLLLMSSTLAADCTELARLIVQFASNDYGSGPALTEYSKSRFSNTRIPAVKTRGPARLESVATIPYTIEPGQLIASTDLGIQFRNVTGGTLAAGPSDLQLEWEAVLAGDSGNVALHAINRLVTSLAGVTIDNDEGDPWYTTAGKDEESDTALRLRNTTKWSRQSVELVNEAYQNIALNNGAVKVLVDDQNPRGPGTIDVYCAAANAQLGSSTLEALQEAFSEQVFQTDSSYPAASDSRCAVKSPTPQTLAVTATLYHDPSYTGSEILGFATQALLDFLTRTPIGGWNYAPGPENVVTRDDLIDVLKDVEGVRSVALTVPAANVSVAVFALVTQGSWSISTVALNS